MIVLVRATVLTVGLNGKNEVLEELPIRVIAKQFGLEAASSLKNEKVDGVISKWDLDDMADGWFLKRLRIAKPDIALVALVRAGDRTQEIAARSLGARAVLTDDESDELFRETVADVLGIRETVGINAMSRIKR
jgi:DNA-binding NarL/FixJ family response regulator